MGIISHVAEEYSYDYLMRRITTESITSPDVLGVFKRVIPHSIELLRSFVPTFAPKQEQGVANLSTRHMAVLKKVSSVNFLAYEETSVQVPEGFDGQLIPYLEVLIMQSKVVLTHGIEVIRDYNTELAMFLSNKDMRQTLKSLSQTYRNVREERMEYEKQVQKFFDKNHSTISRRRLGDVIERFSDLKKIYELEEKLTQIRKQQNIKEISAEIQRASDMLGLIKKRLDAGEIDDVSGQAAKNLAEGAYEVAKYAEYMSMYLYFMETVSASIGNMTDKFEEIF